MPDPDSRMAPPDSEGADNVVGFTSAANAATQAPAAPAADPSDEATDLPEFNYNTLIHPLIRRLHDSNPCDGSAITLTETIEETLKFHSKPHLTLTVRVMLSHTDSSGNAA